MVYTKCIKSGDGQNKYKGVKKMSKEYGFTRISTPKQNIERQIRNIEKEYPNALIIQEVFTGTKIFGRKEFNKLLNTVESGDTIIFDSVSRMSRNAEEGFATYKELFDKGVNLVFLKEPHINTSTYQSAIDSKMLQTNTATGDEDTDTLISSIFEAINTYILKLAEKQILQAFEQSQKEVDDLHQRTSEGIETARRAGKQIGQVKGSTLHIKKKEPTMEMIQKHCKEFGGALSDAEVMKLAGVARNTFYKYKAEVRKKLQEEQM